MVNKVVIERRGRDGRYRATAASRLLRIKAVELTHWLTVEDTSDEARWAKRLASWLETRWAERLRDKAPDPGGRRYTRTIPRNTERVPEERA